MWQGVVRSPGRGGDSLIRLMVGAVFLIGYQQVSVSTRSRSDSTRSKHERRH